MRRITDLHMAVIATAAAKRQNSKFPAAIFVRCPPSLPAAVARAADRSMTNISAYVRGAVLEQLRRDGIDLVVADPAAAKSKFITNSGEQG
jgi:hypothetical protein